MPSRRERFSNYLRERPSVRFLIYLEANGLGFISLLQMLENGGTTFNHEPLAQKAATFALIMGGIVVDAIGISAFAKTIHRESNQNGSSQLTELPLIPDQPPEVLPPSGGD